MIVLNKQNDNQYVYCTPAENTSVVFNYFYVRFVNRITQNIVSFTSENYSTTLRYQLLHCNVFSNFQGEDLGFWSYSIQGSDALNNIDEDILETGFMFLQDVIVAPVKYNEQSNNFVTYNG